MNEPVWNSDIEGYEPCPTCMEIIHDCLGGLSGQDHAVADDTEIVDEDPTEVWIKANGLEELFREA